MPDANSCNSRRITYAHVFSLANQKNEKWTNLWRRQLASFLLAWVVHQAMRDEQIGDPLVEHVKAWETFPHVPEDARHHWRLRHARVRILDRRRIPLGVLKRGEVTKVHRN